MNDITYQSITNLVKSKIMCKLALEDPDAFRYQVEVEYNYLIFALFAPALKLHAEYYLVQALPQYADKDGIFLHDRYYGTEPEFLLSDIVMDKIEEIKTMPEWALDSFKVTPENIGINVQLDMFGEGVLV